MAVTLHAGMVALAVSACSLLKLDTFAVAGVFWIIGISYLPTIGMVWVGFKREEFDEMNLPFTSYVLGII